MVELTAGSAFSSRAQDKRSAITNCDTDFSEIQGGSGDEPCSFSVMCRHFAVIAACIVIFQPRDGRTQTPPQFSEQQQLTRALIALTASTNSLRVSIDALNARADASVSVPAPTPNFPSTAQPVGFDCVFVEVRCCNSLSPTQCLGMNASARGTGASQAEALERVYSRAREICHRINYYLQSDLGQPLCGPQFGNVTSRSG